MYLSVCLPVAGSVVGKCAVCDIAGEHFNKFGVLFCAACSAFLNTVSSGPKEVVECLGGGSSSGQECQVGGEGAEEEEDRCQACWLYRVLTCCSISNILHDHLRKRLPAHLKERVPTSLARCMSVGGASVPLKKDSELAGHMKRLPLDPGGGGAFGSVMDLPGGWRRKIGPEVIVVSPSGEKFRSVQKLEEFLKKQGIRADARVLFGNTSGGGSSPGTGQSPEVRSKATIPGTTGGSRGKVVMTTLPGGWTRRIKWRSAGDRFDTYVYSPDGRTFRSRRELSAYFTLIGKVDDIHKYFPVVTGLSDASIPSSSDTSGSSSTEPFSSSEPFSECEMDLPRNKLCQPPHLSKSEKAGGGQSKPGREQDEGSVAAVAEEGLGGEAGVKDKTLGPRPKLKALSSRSRSLSAPRKKEDTSLTDTTESESEQRKAASVQIFSKTFTRNRSRKSKVVNCPPPFGNNGSSTCLPQATTEAKTPSSPQGSPKDAASNGTDAKEAREVKLSGKKQKKTMQEQDAAVTPEAGRQEPTAEDSRSAGTKASLGRKFKRAAEQVSPVPLQPTEPIAVPGATEGNPTAKIVLKIPKKAIKMKPIRKKIKKRGKHLKMKKVSTLTEVKQPPAPPLTEDKSRETQPPPDSKKPSDTTQGKLSGQEGENDLAELESDGPVDCEMTDKSRVMTSPSMSEGEGAPRQTFRVPALKKAKPLKLKKYETHHFGPGWSRKIRWNERGEGRVALLYSPDGQSFRSRIELSAYFKKAGKPRVDLDYYFPLILRRATGLAAGRDTSAPLTSTSAQSSETSEFSDSDAFVKTSEDSWGSGEEGGRRQMTRNIKYLRTVGSRNKLEDVPEDGAVAAASVPYHNSGKPSSCLQPFQEDGRKMMVLPSKGGKNIAVSIQEVKPVGGLIAEVKSETEEGEELLDEAGGPRVKHVCRSQAQVCILPWGDDSCTSAVYILLLILVWVRSFID